MTSGFFNSLFTLITCFLAFILKAQIVPHKKYTTIDGLIADRVTSITQDSSGMMWFGTHYGICRYDGQKFNVINLPQQQQQKFVTALSNDTNTVYAGFLFNGGIIKYEKGKITPILSENSQYGPNEVTVVYNGLHEKTWIVASGKLYTIKENKLKLIFDFTQYNTTISLLLEKDEKSIWAGTDKGIFILKKEKEGYAFSKKIYNNNNIFSLCKDWQNNIWVGAGNSKNTSINFHDASSQYTLIKTLYNNPSIQFIKFSGNQSSGFWGIDKKGLFNLKSDGKIVHFPSIINIHSFTSCIYADRENNIWIANDPGIIKYSHAEVKTYYFDELAAAGGNLINTQKNGIIASNSKFLYQIHDEKIQKLAEFRSKKDFYFLGFVTEVSKSQILASRWHNGFWKIRLKGSAIADKSFTGNYKEQPLNFSSFTTDKKGSIWMAGINILVKMVDGKIAEKISTKEIAPYLHITSIAVDEANSVIWLGENTTGVFKIKYKTHKSKTILQPFQHFNNRNGLTDPFIRSLFLDSENILWVGTRYGGVFQYINSKQEFLQKKFEGNNEVICTRVTSISEEPKKAIWFATCNGVYRFFYKQNKWEHFGTSSGLPSAEVFSIAIDTTINTAWALTSEGVTAIKYDGRRKKSPPPIVNLTAINVLGQPDTAALNTDKNINYSFDKNSIGFSFNSPSFIDETKVIYKYKLDGYDNHWSNPTLHNNVTYASLPPGDYIFSIMAANADSVWSNEPATFTFSIIRPFYKETWFYILIFFITGFVLYLIQIFRLRQKMHLQKLRLNIARDLHDDVGSALGSINLLSKNAGRRLNEIKSAEDITGTLDKIGTSAQNTLEAMDDIIWSINPEKDTWQDLMVRMKEFAIPLTEARDMEFELNADPGDYNKMPMHLRRNIFLIFKETITNSIKYSASAKLYVDIRIKNDTFYMLIKDDGKGFDVNSKTNRNGIKNLITRAEILKGKIEVDSVPKKGTTIKFNCPLR